MPRLRIDLGEPLHVKADLAWHGLVNSQDPREPIVLVRGNELVRMTERGELEDFGVDALRDLLSHVCEFGRTDKDGEFKPADPPVDVAKVMLARDSGEYVDAPRVDRVVDVPVMTADASLLERAGHHAGSRLYYRPAKGLEGLTAASAETVDDVIDAVSTLREDLLGDFDFEDEASAANAMGLLLLPFVREFIPGPTPLHVVLAPDVGSGKTTLAQACLIPGCGQVPVTPQTSSEEEWRKGITAALLGGQSAILLDNLSGELDSGSLAAALTSGVWRDRILGESRQVTLPIRNAWVATGNNLGLSREQIRRAVPIFLRAQDDEQRPADRPREAFRHPDLLGWAERNRASLVSAALTLVRHWADGPTVSSGGTVLLRTGEAPVEGRKTLGSFERWAGVVGGVLDAAGIHGFMENRDRLQVEADAQGEEAREFLEGWVRYCNQQPLTVAELATRAQFGGELHDLLPSDLMTGSASGLHKRLAYWLRQQKDVDHDGLRVTKDDRGRRARWYVRGSISE